MLLEITKQFVRFSDWIQCLCIASHYITTAGLFVMIMHVDIWGYLHASYFKLL